MKTAIQPVASDNEAETLAWLRLARTENVGTVAFYRLLDRFRTAKEALGAIPQLAARGGRKKPLVIPPLDAVEREYELLRRLGGRIVTAAMPEYSLSLAATEDAPPVLSLLGNADLLNRESIGMVGARNASLNGKKFAEKLARDLGQAGQVIASGLARGIDTAAHDGSLATGTIAVVAGGIDVIYPPENKNLYERIVKEGGLIVAESPLGQQPFAQSFPRRNRIISGLSSGIVVVEATMKSGSLITARLAGEQGRDVFAVPGHPLDPRAEGPNAIIRDGATLIRSAADVLEQTRQFAATKLPYQMSDGANDAYDASPVPDDDISRQRVLDALSFSPVAVDEVIRASGLPASAVLSILMELELAGMARRQPGNRVARTE